MTAYHPSQLHVMVDFAAGQYGKRKKMGEVHADVDVAVAVADTTEVAVADIAADVEDNDVVDGVANDNAWRACLAITAHF